MRTTVSRVQLAIAALLLSSAAARAADPAATGSHTFTYAPPAGAATVPVSIAGDFNGWSATPNPMVRGADGTYAVTVAMPAGLHHYKLVLDGKWIADPDNADHALEADDGFGGKNSGFTVTPGATAAPAAGSATHTFRYVPPAGAATVPVSIAGDFNGWSAKPDPMVRGADGAYAVTVAVPPGVHHYKLVLDGKWIADPGNADHAMETDDGFGGKNSGFTIAGGAPAGPAVAAAAGTSTHTFRYAPPAGAATVPVSIAGDFNGWSATPDPMVRGADGSYAVTVAMPPGVHHYKLVLNGKWIADPGNADHALETDDGFGGKNSGFTVGGSAAAATPAAAPAVAMSPHTFKFTPPAGAATVPVGVAGDFNGWTATTPLTRGADGVYSGTAKVPNGLHHYKVVYDGKWIADPAGDQDLEVDDGFGGKNSGFVAGPPVKPENPKDGKPIDVPHGSAATHTFRFVPPAGSPTVPVSVAGDFNGWTATTPLTRGPDGAYTGSAEMEAGQHHYKIVDDGKWITDPAGDKTQEQIDGFGGQNSGFVAGLEADQLPPAEAGVVTAGGVIFDPANPTDLDVISPAEARLSFRDRADDAAEAFVDTGTSRTPMTLVSTTAGVNRFTAIVPPGPFTFELRKPDAVAYVADGRAFPMKPAATYTAPAAPTFVTPDWAQHAVWYQILPERFRNGDTSNDPARVAAWTSKWYDLQPGETGDFYQGIWDRRYGGDLQGIRQELPYLRKLGVTAIYLNPIFQAHSLHKYDTTDYRHVDEHFGVLGDIEQLRGETEDPATWQWTPSDKVFLDLIAEAHRQGFHVIIDGVYNHAGTRFWAFQDVVKNGRNSKYVGWFDIIDWNPGVDREGHPIPFHYKAWDGDNGQVPQFKKDPVLGIVHGPREHILAVAKRWLAPDGDPSRGVDGFRLDAPELVPHPFWVDFRNLVKGIKPDALMVGEIWPWAQPWLGGDQFDCVMNYQFAIPAQLFFANRDKAIPPTALDAACERLVTDYPFQVALANQNLLDSHDTDRAGSMIVNPDLGYDMASRIEDGHPTYSPRKPNAAERQRLLQEVAFQMTFVGAPMVYYGDEAGMWGAGDPSDRQPMIWPDLGRYADPEVTFDQNQFDWYQRLIAIRQALPALQTGTYHKLVADDATGTFAFARDLGDRHAYVVLNRSDRPATVVVPGVVGPSLLDWTDAGSVDVATAGDRPRATPRADAKPLTITGGSVSVVLPPYGSAVLAPPAR